MTSDTRSFLPARTEETKDRQEREATRELERMEWALNRKKSGYKPRRRRSYADYR